MTGKLNGQARAANAAYVKATKEKFPKAILQNHLGISWDVFTDESDYLEAYTFLGTLSSPSMSSYDLSKEYNSKYKESFLARMEAHCVSQDIPTWNICYREKKSFGTTPKYEEMTFPFERITNG
jgi:hypothetical protein